MSKVKETEEKEKRNILGDIIFYFALFCVLAGLLFSQQSNSGPKVIGGYAVFHVLTSSMEPEIPRQALVITQEVPATSLSIGDDITYMVGPSTSITHRIIGITENYQGTGSRGFDTQGINNSKKDKEVVMEDNIVGKVIYTNKILGKCAVFLTNNWYLVIIYIFSFAIIKKLLMSYMSRHDEEDEEEQENNEQSKIQQGNVSLNNTQNDINGAYAQVPTSYDQWGNPITGYPQQYMNDPTWNQQYQGQWQGNMDPYGNLINYQGNEINTIYNNQYQQQGMQNQNMNYNQDWNSNNDGENWNQPL